MRSNIFDQFQIRGVKLIDYLLQRAKPRPFFEWARRTGLAIVPIVERFLRVKCLAH